MFVRAKELPKAALVEFQVNLHTGQREEESGRYGMVEERDEHIGQEKHDWEDDGGEMILTPEWITAQAGDPMYWEILQTDTGAKLGSRAMVFVRGRLGVRVGSVTSYLTCSRCFIRNP